MDIEVSHDIQAPANIFSIVELGSESKKTDEIAGKEGENSVGCECSVIHAEAPADDDVGWVADEEDHASHVSSGKLGHESRGGVELSDFCVIDKEHSSREDDRVVAKEYAETGEHKVEVEVEFPAIGATSVANPEGSGLEDAGDIEGDCHVGEGEEEDEDVEQLDAMGHEVIDQGATGLLAFSVSSSATSPEPTLA